MRGGADPAAVPATAGQNAHFRILKMVLDLQGENPLCVLTLVLILHFCGELLRRLLRRTNSPKYGEQLPTRGLFGHKEMNPGGCGGSLGKFIGC